MNLVLAVDFLEMIKYYRCNPHVRVHEMDK